MFCSSFLTFYSKECSHSDSKHGVLCQSIQSLLCILYLGIINWLLPPVQANRPRAISCMFLLWIRWHWWRYYDQNLCKILFYFCTWALFIMNIFDKHGSLIFMKVCKSSFPTFWLPHPSPTKPRTFLGATVLYSSTLFVDILLPTSQNCWVGMNAMTSLIVYPIMGK